MFVVEKEFILCDVAVNIMYKIYINLALFRSEEKHVLSSQCYPNTTLIASTQTPY
jgi:hypothetical protein